MAADVSLAVLYPENVHLRVPLFVQTPSLHNAHRCVGFHADAHLDSGHPEIPQEEGHAECFGRRSGNTIELGLARALGNRDVRLGACLDHMVADGDLPVGRRLPRLAATRPDEVHSARR